MHCLLFPGQGVQRRGMGAGLFEEYPELTAAASEALGEPIDELCLRDERRRLRDTRYAQPAIFFVNALLGLRALAADPDAYAYLAGHSLGEYNALVLGGWLDLRQALTLVVRRAELMAQVTGGGMAAVLGVPGVLVERALRETQLSKVYIANRNADTQTTIAGDSAELQAAARAMAALPGARVVRINVSGPFHTPLMEPVQAALAELLRDCAFSTGRLPVVSSVTGEPFAAAHAVELLSRQVSAPVEWTRAVRTLRAAGVSHFDEVNGRTLTSLTEGIR
ncbi:acyltransferase domain-containing protein [Kitasatospora sp. NBC_01287]|uniref:ACP S-malonyltransferase n=1 Tax=Kitasatospora sp. NBC_01287 TaxID=2903573 RepID=UPI00225A2F11|nr:acyltransferase domain-containing protein [Kitasatospora sp. NBC_01287]MCX4751655.1 acyltransferase domain-containing protein [Kitasatospora sp. NBC_01287]